MCGVPSWLYPLYISKPLAEGVAGKFRVKNSNRLNEQGKLAESNVTTALSALVDWVQKRALSTWVERSFHTSDGWFSAQLSHSGRPIEGESIQLVAQAQMLYLLARAERIGWVSGRRKIAQQLIDFVGRHGTLPCRSDGYVRSLEAPSVILDSRYDPLDHAWFVIANTACFSAFGEMSDMRRAYNILDWLHIHYSDGTTWKGIGRSSEAEPELYRHMLWALVDLAEVTQKPIWHQRAKALLDHCIKRFGLPVEQPSKKSLVAFDHGEQLAWVRVLCQCERVFGVGLNAAKSFYEALSIPLGSEAKVTGEVRAEVIAAGLALFAADVKGASTDKAIEQLDIFIRDYAVPDTDRAGIFIDDPWNGEQGVGSLITLVHLFEAAVLAQQILARRSHSA